MFRRFPSLGLAAKAGASRGAVSSRGKAQIVWIAPPLEPRRLPWQRRARSFAKGFDACRVPGKDSGAPGCCRTLPERALQNLAQDILFARIELVALRREVEDVDGLLAFSIDERNLDIAVKPRQSRAHVVEKAGAILRDNFEQRAVHGSLFIEADSCRDRNLRRASAARRFTALQQWLERGLAAQDFGETFLEALDFAGIQLERAMQVGKVESVEHHARGIGKRIGFDDVHAPSREYARNRREQARPVGGKQRQRETVALGLQLRLQQGAAEFAVQRKVRGNFRRRVNGEIAPREAFKKALDFRARRSARGGLHLRQYRGFI